MITKGQNGSFDGDKRLDGKVTDHIWLILNLLHVCVCFVGGRRRSIDYYDVEYVKPRQGILNVKKSNCKKTTIINNKPIIQSNCT